MRSCASGPWAPSDAQLTALARGGTRVTSAVGTAELEQYRRFQRFGGEAAARRRAARAPRRRRARRPCVEDARRARPPPGVAAAVDRCRPGRHLALTTSRNARRAGQDLTVLARPPRAGARPASAGGADLHPHRGLLLVDDLDLHARVGHLHAGLRDLREPVGVAVVEDRLRLLAADLVRARCSGAGRARPCAAPRTGRRTPARASATASRRCGRGGAGCESIGRTGRHPGARWCCCRRTRCPSTRRAGRPGTGSAPPCWCSRR